MGSTARKFRVLVVSEEIADNLSDGEKERLARRRVLATTGRCPCGATLELPRPVPGSVLVVAVEHEPGCPAADDDPGRP